MGVRADVKMLNMEVFFIFFSQFLKNVPNHANVLRYLILFQFDDIVFNTIFQEETNPQKVDFQEKAKVSLLKHAHKILDETVLLTLKQINNPVI